MKKTILLSGLVLGMLGVGTAAQADEKEPEMKTAVANTKVYENEGLEDSKKVKEGSVYTVKGTKKIDGKTYEKAYQDDEFVGYIESNKLRHFDGLADKRKVKIVKSDYERWDNFYWSKSKGTAEKGKVYQVKARYQIGNGKNYYSLYDDNGKFAGYINANATDEKNVWTTSSAIILFKRAYQNNEGVFDKYLEIGNYDYNQWKPKTNKKNTIVLERKVNNQTKYIKMISVGTNTVMSVYKSNDKKLTNPEVTFTIQNNSAKIIKTDK